MIVLGLTGSIGMGKSTAAAVLRRLGVPLYDADAEIHRMLGRGGSAVAAVEAAFPGVRGEDGASDGIRDIVEFEIEENAGAEFTDPAHGFGTCSGEELTADFEHADEVCDLFGKSQGRCQRIKIQSYDQTASRMGVEGQGSGRARSFLALVRTEVRVSELRRQLHELQPHLAHAA